MTVILAIDPGSSRSAWVLLDGQRVRDHAIVENDQLLRMFRWPSEAPWQSASVAVIEWTAPRGMPASAELFETLWWAGRFAEALHPTRVERLARLDIKRHLCGTTAAKDANVRAALIDRYGGAGGKEAAIGRKATPGPLYGVSADEWAALAVAVTFHDQEVSHGAIAR